MAVELAQEIDISLIRIDGDTQPRAALNYDTINDYAQCMMEGDVFPALIVHYDGENYWLTDGFHRYHAAKLAGRDTIDADIRKGDRRKAKWESYAVNSKNGMRMTTADKQKIVTEILQDPEWSQYPIAVIARHCGVDRGTVRKYQDTLKWEFPTLQHSNTETAKSDYKELPVNNWKQSRPEIPLLPFQELARQELTQEEADEEKTEEPKQAHVFPSLSQWQADNRELGLDEWANPMPVQEEPRRIGVPAALLTSESNEWFTPPEYVSMARELMGGIDVDPASNAYANEKVQATTYYDIQTNGLDKEWHGRVWLNPPYGRDEGGSNQEAWSRRLIEQFELGNTKEAVLLVNANTEAKWFQPLYNYTICFTNHRIRFYNTEGTPSQPTQGNAFIYFGSYPERFTELFSTFGVVIRRIDK